LVEHLFFFWFASKRLWAGSGDVRTSQDGSRFPTREADGETIVVPLRSQADLKLDKTNLLSRLVEIWGEVPIRLIQHLDLRKSVYGLIGMSDFTMYPILGLARLCRSMQASRNIADKMAERARTADLLYRVAGGIHLQLV